jgi:hypothetical protein
MAMQNQVAMLACYSFLYLPRFAAFLRGNFSSIFDFTIFETGSSSLSDRSTHIDIFQQLQITEAIISANRRLRLITELLARPVK